MRFQGAPVSFTGEEIVSSLQQVEPTMVQHGAMEFTAAPVDLGAVRKYRLDQLRAQMRKRDVAGMLLLDPINTRYATDSTNMQIWCTHFETRCVFIAQEGPVVLFDYDYLPYLAQGLTLIDEYRAMPVFHYATAGSKAEDAARRFAGQIAEFMCRHGSGNRRLAVDRLSQLGTDALREQGLSLLDALPLTEQARAIKSAEEIVLMKASMMVCEAGCSAMQAALIPGITENALWAKLHETNIRLGGEWIETRLLSSGPRTNPWFRECSMRPIEKGDLVSFDTDLIGPYGYCADISRSWICGDQDPTPEQRQLYSMAHEQLEHNISILRPGMTFREVAEASWDIPREYQARRYSCLAHGIGLADEYPTIPYKQDYEIAGYGGIVEPGMALCIESFIGVEGGREGVKLEDQVLVTENAIERISTYPFEERLLR